MVCEWYEVAGYRFGIRTTSHAFAAWVRYALGAYATEPTEEEVEDSYPTYSVVVEDGSRGADRVGRRFHILYLGTWDVARTLDLGFLARCLLRQVDAIGHHERGDALFLETGTIEVHGEAFLVPTYLVPALSVARRRAGKMGIWAPGGMVAAIDTATGELVAPPLDLDVPDDAFERLRELLPVDPGREQPDRFVVEDGQRRPLAGVIRPWVDPTPSRAETTVSLLTNVKNFSTLGGGAVRAMARAMSSASIVDGRWTSTNEMLQRLADAGAAAAGAPVRGTP